MKWVSTKKNKVYVRKQSVIIFKIYSYKKHGNTYILVEFGTDPWVFLICLFKFEGVENISLQIEQVVLPLWIHI